MPFEHSAEQEIKEYFAQKGIGFADHSSSYEKLDFTILDKNGLPLFRLDVKEKRQRYNLKNWPSFAPEPDLVILDDLTVRKCLAYAPQSGLLVRDSLCQQYIFFSVIDLALMPRMRVNRPIQRNQPQLKGKWLINARNGKASQALDQAIAHIGDYLNRLDTTLLTSTACYGTYVDETIDSGGIVRQPSHWDTDVQNTR
ncbi:MAG: hypothetical protein KF893_15100 [Caldilineaceae bacterium]|nr:hypothetical protein [Caldilineaceae bacterium]